MAYYIRAFIGRPGKGSRQSIYTVVGPFPNREKARTEAITQSTANPDTEWELCDAVFASLGVPLTRKRGKRARQKRSVSVTP